MANLQITTLPIAALRPYARNARTHSPKQIAQIAASIAEFGFTNPVLIDSDNGIIAGHGRVAAAKLVGIETVPCVRIEHLTEAQKRAYVIADNRLAEKAGWDSDILAIELQHLIELDVDFDVTITGFEMAEIDVLLGSTGASNAQSDPADAVPQAPVVPVTRRGDVWELGRHRLLCGDATDADAYARLLAGEKAQMVFTDPPYNVKVDGHVGGRGKVKHREFAFASGEMSEGEFTAFLARVFANLAAHAADGAMHFVAMDWRHLGEVLAAGKVAFSELKNLCVWAKSNGGMGSLYRSQHELVFVFKKGQAPHLNTVELGQKIYRGGIAEKGVPACAACHSPNGAGIPAQYPRVGSQHADYTEAQLVAFRSGARGNSAQMVTIAAKMSDREIKAVSDYIAGLR